MIIDMLLMSVAMAGISFSVRGMPVTQGSKTGYRRGDRIIIVDAQGDRLKAWRHAVSDEARKALPDDWQLITGPVRLTLTFRMPKPLSAPRRKRTWPIGSRSGDCSKLVRAVEDSLSQVVFADDCQIVEQHATKDYATPENPPGVDVVVEEVTGE